MIPDVYIVVNCHFRLRLWALELERSYLAKLPRCDFCSAKAEYDGKTRDGPWAYMCEAHFRLRGIGLGVGRGQRLVEDKNQQVSLSKL